MPGTQPREHEAKFQVAAEMLPPLQLTPLPLDGYTFQSIGTVAQTDTYMDTPAYDLLRQGLALRVRDKGTTHEVGLKSIIAVRKGAIQNRMDIAIPLPAHAKPTDPRTWPAQVTSHLAPYHVDLDELHPLVLVSQQRQKAHIYRNGRAHPLAEWSLDKVWVVAEPDQANPTSPNNAHFHELEIELLPPADDTADHTVGDAENASHDEQDLEGQFAALVEQVQTHFALTPIYTSKLVRGLQSALAHDHDQATAITPTMTLEAAGRLLLHQQLFQILLNEHGVRTSKKSKYVHDMRVAIRRARAAIQLCADAYPADTLTLFTKGLKQLAQALGAVRDLDVARENLSDFASSQPEEQQHGIKLLRRELKTARAQNHKALVKLLKSKKHRKFVKKFLHFCTTPIVATKHPTQTALPHPEQVCHTLPSRILAAFEAVRAFETLFVDGNTPPLEVFHACRIHGKYLRYLLEFTQHLLGNPGAEISQQLGAIQEQSGQLNDAHVEQIRLAKWAQADQEGNTLQAAIAARQTEVAAQIAELTTTIPTHFQAFISLPNRQKLATALASL